MLETGKSAESFPVVFRYANELLKGEQHGEIQRWKTDRNLL
jgi:hypothetical protein